MKIKTSELTGAALDWAVMTCEGYVQPQPIEWILGGHFKPSTDWSQGGSIIDRERISVEYTGNAGRSWFAKPPGNPTRKRNQMKDGPTPLIAAMRCYVASKLGDTVEIPDELC